MTSWLEIRRRMEHELADLAVGEFILVGEPEPPPGPPRGMLRRRHQLPSRYVQVRSDGEGTLYSECVGATIFGGEWDVSCEPGSRGCAQIPWRCCTPTPRLWCGDEIIE